MPGACVTQREIRRKTSSEISPTRKLGRREILNLPFFQSKKKVAKTGRERVLCEQWEEKEGKIIAGKKKMWEEIDSICARRRKKEGIKVRGGGKPEPPGAAGCDLCSVTRGAVQPGVVDPRILPCSADNRPRDLCQENQPHPLGFIVSSCLWRIFECAVPGTRCLQTVCDERCCALRSSAGAGFTAPSLTKSCPRPLEEGNLGGGLGRPPSMLK